MTVHVIISPASSASNADTHLMGEVCCRCRQLQGAQQLYMTVHFFFLSVGSASNIFCKRSAITGKLGLLLGWGSQHSSTRCFTASGTTFPNLQRSAMPRQRVKHLLQAHCNGGEAGWNVGLLIPAYFHQVLRGL